MTSCALTVGRVEQGLNSLLNSRLAESWDNVGLLIGDRSRVVRRMLLCVDMTRPVLKEARAKRIDFVLAYHPPIFEPLRSMLADTQCNIYQAVQAGLAVYAIHTAFDMILGGTSDALADVVGMEDRKPITPTVRSDRSKLVVFVPQDHVEQVASAVFEAGGGVIGDYTRCSFRTGGSGTFLGSDATTPAVGRSGRFETVAETRLEIVVDNSKLPDTVRRMKRVHPYEEPAFDI